MAVDITATVQTGFTPPRVAIVITGLTITDDVTVYRVNTETGTRTIIRGGQRTATKTTIGLVDWEAPFATELAYVVAIDDIDVDTSDTVTLTSGVDTPAVLSDVTTGLAAAVDIGDLPRAHNRPGTIYQTSAGTNVAVLGPRGQWSGRIVLVTEGQEQADALRALLAQASGGLVQLRQDGTIPGIDCYLVVISDAEMLVSLWDSQEFAWVMDVAQVDAWSSTVDAYREVTNLASDPAATANGLVDGELTWSPLWYGPGSGAGSTTLLTGQTDGPVAWVTTYMRKTWSAAPSSNGDTGFAHSSGWATSDAGYPVSPGDVYTITSYLRPSASNKQAAIDVYWHEADGTQTLDAGTPVTLSANTWTRITRTVTVPSGMYSMSPASNVHSGGTTWANGNTLDGTGLMVEAGDTAHQYGDGSTPGWAWLGTANESPSHGWELPL